MDLGTRKTDCTDLLSHKDTYFIKESDLFTFYAVKKNRKNRFQRKIISFCYKNDDYAGKFIE